MVLTAFAMVGLLSVATDDARPCAEMQTQARPRVIRLSTLEADPREAPDRRFTNRRIDIDMKNADVHNLLRLLAEVAQLNLVVADDVSGSVTLKMKNARWEDVLRAIARVRKLDYDWQGNMIMVERAH